MHQNSKDVFELRTRNAVLLGDDIDVSLGFEQRDRVFQTYAAPPEDRLAERPTYVGNQLRLPEPRKRDGSREAVIAETGRTPVIGGCACGMSEMSPIGD